MPGVCERLQFWTYIYVHGSPISLAGCQASVRSGRQKVRCGYPPSFARRQNRMIRHFGYWKRKVMANNMPCAKHNSILVAKRAIIPCVFMRKAKPWKTYVFSRSRARSNFPEAFSETAFPNRFHAFSLCFSRILYHKNLESSCHYLQIKTQHLHINTSHASHHGLMLWSVAFPHRLI